MNKVLLAGIAFAAGLSALAQGTININNNYTVPGASTKALVVGADKVAVPTALGRVEVLSSTGEVISSVKDGTGNAFSGAGLFFLGTTVVPNIPAAGTGSIIIRAWDSSTGSTYASALNKAAQIVTVTGLGGGITTPPTLATASANSFAGLTLVPEPSTVALAALGLVGLCFAARRK